MKISHKLGDKFRKFLAFSKFFSHFFSKYRDILSFPEHFYEIPAIFFFRAHRTKDHTRKQEKVGPFECDVLEKQSRVSARRHPLTVRILHNGKRKRTPKRLTNHEPYSTDQNQNENDKSQRKYAKSRNFVKKILKN